MAGREKGGDSGQRQGRRSGSSAQHLAQCTAASLLSPPIALTAPCPAAPHPAPRSFTSKVCKKTKTFGEPVEKVLFVFDGQKAPDMNALVAQVRRWAGRCWGGGC